MKLHIFFYLVFFIFNASLFASEQDGQRAPVLQLAATVGTLSKEGMNYKELVNRTETDGQWGPRFYNEYYNVYQREGTSFAVQRHRVLLTAQGTEVYRALPTIVCEGDEAKSRFEEIAKRFREQNP